MILLWLILGIILMVLLGFSSQVLLEKTVDINANRGKIKFSYHFPKMMMVQVYRWRIKLLKNTSSKNKIYFTESKKTNSSDISDVFLNTIIQYERAENSGYIIQAVAHEQEKRRRKSEAPSIKKERKMYFYVQEVIMSKIGIEGFEKKLQVPYTLYLNYYVHYHMFLKGKDVPYLSLSEGVNYFGTVLEKENMLLVEEQQREFRDLYKRTARMTEENKELAEEG